MAIASNSKRSTVTIENAASWVLRVGVVVSVAVMLMGIFVSFLHNHVQVDRMQHSTFDYQPSTIWLGIREVRGKAIIETGIYLLVLTPVIRVITSMVLFVVKERDWLYAGITLIVLVLTLAGFVLVR
jgi:uncharacterized membrane protein